MEHTYFYPIVKDQGRMNTLSGSPTASGMGGNNGAGVVPNSPILSPGPGSTPIPAGQGAQQ